MTRWRDPPHDDDSAWMGAWEAAMEGAVDLPCPTCRRGQLRFYAVRFRPPDDRGGLWIWCPACGVYAHGSGTVPSWWVDDPQVSVDLVELEHEPEWLDTHWDEISRRGDTGER